MARTRHQLNRVAPRKPVPPADVLVVGLMVGLVGGRYDEYRHTHGG
jgi:hypothetical protein